MEKWISGLAAHKPPAALFRRLLVCITLNDELIGTAAAAATDTAITSLFIMVCGASELSSSRYLWNNSKQHIDCTWLHTTAIQCLEHLFEHWAANKNWRKIQQFALTLRDSPTFKQHSTPYQYAWCRIIELAAAYQESFDSPSTSEVGGTTAAAEDYGFMQAFFTHIDEFTPHVSELIDTVAIEIERRHLIHNMPRIFVKHPIHAVCALYDSYGIRSHIEPYLLESDPPPGFSASAAGSGSKRPPLISAYITDVGINWIDALHYLRQPPDSDPIKSINRPVLDRALLRNHDIRPLPIIKLLHKCHLIPPAAAAALIPTESSKEAKGGDGGGDDDCEVVCEFIRTEFLKPWMHADPTAIELIRADSQYVIDTASPQPVEQHHESHTKITNSTSSSASVNTGNAIRLEKGTNKKNHIISA